MSKSLTLHLFERLFRKFDADNSQTKMQQKSKDKEPVQGQSREGVFEENEPGVEAREEALGKVSASRAGWSRRRCVQR